jgi:hypothetical protein
MKIAHLIPSVVPAKRYGGSERAVFWLMEQLSEMGHASHLFAQKGSSNSFGSFSELPKSQDDWLMELDRHKIDIVHFNTLPCTHFPKSFPHVVTIHGNGKPHESFPLNSIFVSQNHAQRHKSEHFVYNGLNLKHYPLVRSPQKTHEALFLAKASWRVKNLRGAIKIASKAHYKLNVAGGRRPLTLWGISAFQSTFYGKVDDVCKKNLFAKSDALLFPVLWDEPFGIATIEALASGLPVIATPFGALPEIISHECGLLSQSSEEMAEFLNSSAAQIDSSACRERVNQNFNITNTAQKYFNYYKRVLAGEILNAEAPYTQPSSREFVLDPKK